MGYLWIWTFKGSVRVILLQKLTDSLYEIDNHLLAPEKKKKNFT